MVTVLEGPHACTNNCRDEFRSHPWAWALIIPSSLPECLIQVKVMHPRVSAKTQTGNILIFFPCFPFAKGQSAHQQHKNVHKLWERHSSYAVILLHTCCPTIWTMENFKERNPSYRIHSEQSLKICLEKCAAIMFCLLLLICIFLLSLVNNTWLYFCFALWHSDFVSSIKCSCSIYLLIMDTVIYMSCHLVIIVFKYLI